MKQDSRQLSRKDVEKINTAEKKKKDMDVNQREWAEISGILDRFIFIVLMLISLVTTLICIFASPHFDH